MNYRKFGKLTWEASALGFGCMRLPIDKNSNELNQPLSKKMIRYAIDHGVNYIDTAYTYHQGMSEVLVGDALKDGYREKVKVATKMPSWLIQSQQDMDKYFEEQIKRLRVNYIDFYLLHGLNSCQWRKLKQLDVISWLERKIAEGVIKYVGFSFHDNFDVFKEIVDSYSGWTFCQIQYNYMDADNQAGRRGLEYASSKGLGIVVMEPLGGGKLAVTPPNEIKSLWKSTEIKRNPPEWAFRWVWNQPQVSVVLSGMNTLNQVVENLELASQSKPCVMTESEFAIFERVIEKYKELGFIKCSGCGYCMPCPNGVNIPNILAFYHDYRLMGKPKNIKGKYWDYITPKSQARRCVGCGRCEDLCPQKMAVRKALSDAELVFESGYSQIICYPKWGLRLVRNGLRKLLRDNRSDFQSED